MSRRKIREEKNSYYGKFICYIEDKGWWDKIFFPWVSNPYRVGNGWLE